VLTERKREREREKMTPLFVWKTSKGEIITPKDNSLTSHKWQDSNYRDINIFVV
jgi:hypothetical protein